MSRRSDDSDFFMLLALLAAGLIAGLVWKFSTAVNLDLKTGGAVLLNLLVWMAFFIASWKWGDDYGPFSLRSLWPLFLGFFWACWFPALDYWALQGLPEWVLGEEHTPWWAKWYTKGGGFLLLAGGGYFIKTQAE